MWLLWLAPFVALGLAYGVGSWLRTRRQPAAASSSDEEANFDGYIVSGGVGLLALLMGFTFGLAVDRFDARRLAVLQESNAIGTTYLRAQTFPEPQRGQLSQLLTRYVDVRLALAMSNNYEKSVRLLADTEALHASLWTVTIAAVAP